MSWFSRNLLFLGKRSVKNFSTEFNKGPKKGLNVDTRSQTDERTDVVSTKEVIFNEIIWNANLMKQGNFINVFLAQRVSGTYAHHQEH